MFGGNYDFEEGFADLPMDLVQDLLDQSERLASTVKKQIAEMEQIRVQQRQNLQNKGLLGRDVDLGYYDVPTSCGIDGAYAVDRLLALDFCIVAAVAVEGITPPSAQSHWATPHHRAYVDAYPHDEDTPILLRGLMTQYEISLAVEAPHSVVMLDGSLSTPTILMDMAVQRLLLRSRASGRLETINHVGQMVIESFSKFVKDYSTIVSNRRSDKIWVGIPKYTSNHEFGIMMNWDTKIDDRAVFTNVLEPGEFAGPIPIQRPKRAWHLASTDPDDVFIEKDIEALLSELLEVQVVYYRPTPFVPAMRLEIPGTVAADQMRLCMLLQTFKHQCMTPGMMEPFPLYMADRMVKNIGTAMPALKQNATMALSEEGSLKNMESVFFHMHGYRTD